MTGTFTSLGEGRHGHGHFQQPCALPPPRLMSHRVACSSLPLLQVAVEPEDPTMAAFKQPPPSPPAACKTRP